MKKNSFIQKKFVPNFFSLCNCNAHIFSESWNNRISADNGKVTFFHVFQYWNAKVIKEKMHLVHWRVKLFFRVLHSIEDFENLNYAILTANNNNVANRIGLNTFYVTDVGLEQYILSMHYRAHWTYLLQILSKLCFQRVALSGNYEIVAISTDKNTFFNDL